MKRLIEIHAPVKGVFQWLPLALDWGQWDQMKEMLKWPSRCVPCVDPVPSTVTTGYAKDVTDHSITWDAWLQYPREGNKLPWGLVASGSEEDMHVFSQGMLRRVTIMPRYDV